MTLDEYDQMLSEQDGVCALCHKPDPTGRRLSVDHDHDTGRVRGLLCIRCNNALRTLGDSESTLRTVLRYVEEPHVSEAA